MRLLMAFLFLTLAAPASAVIADDEDANDALGTASVGLTGAPGLVADAGILSLNVEDVDFILLSGLSAGDVVTAVTTPLDDELFEDPDTIMGIFDSNGSLLAFSDDANNEEGVFEGLGSLIRYGVQMAGDYYVAISGFGDDDFDGLHTEDGDYVLSISIVSAPEPSTALLMFGALGLLAARRRLTS